MKGKLIFVLSLLIILMAFSAARAEYFGTPEPLARDGNFSLGVGYAYLSNKYQFTSSSDTFKFEQNQIYLQVNAFYRYLEFYGRVGGADFRMKDAPGALSDFSDHSFQPFVTVGTKGKWDFAPHLSLGPFLEGSYFAEHSDELNGQNVDIGGYYKVDIGLFLQAKFQPVIIYAGPFAYIVRGGDISVGSFSQDFEEKGNFGAAAGIRINLYKGLNIGVEAQYMEELSAGGLISYSF
jgi:hypothetical protein